MLYPVAPRFGDLDIFSRSQQFLKCQIEHVFSQYSLIISTSSFIWMLHRSMDKLKHTMLFDEVSMYLWEIIDIIFIVC